MNIPPALDILARAADLRGDAQRQRDTSAVKAFNAVIVTVVCHYGSLAWDGQYLTVASLSHPGQTHQVSGFGCSCEAHRPCFHMRLRELLIGIMETEAETADQEADDEALLDEAAVLIDQLDAIHGDADFEADVDEPTAPQWKIGALFAARPLGPRYAAARAKSAYAYQ